MEILQTLLQILIFPGLLFQVVVGLLLAGIDRKVVARMQHRVGPPILQPTYDFFKLMGKETIVPAAANKTVYLLAPVVGFVGLVILGLFVPVFGTNVFGTGADLIVILYLLTVPAVCLIVVGMENSEHIIAINSDADAPIFEIADVGIVGDFFEIVPRFLEK